MSSANEWFSVQVGFEGLSLLGCPGVQRYEGEPLAKQVRLSGTPDLVAGPLVGGNSPDDFYIDVARPSGAHFVKPEARVASGSFREQHERSYMKTVEDKIATYDNCADSCRVFSNGSGGPSAAGRSCVCSEPVSETARGTGTFTTTASGRLTLTSLGSNNPGTFQYCVKGDELVIIGEDESFFSAVFSRQ